ncbi:MAG: hypothetical protein MR352_00025 [Ruminococcus sp.]|nr:hypothetical protein [Ruminococcus sp.]MCI5616452.1 hypothetical protein [Ruminococcus sp.]
MSDEEITIKVTTNVDASEVESLEKSIEQLSNSTIDVTTESDDSQLVETEEKIDEIDGSVIENNVEVDNSQLEETQEKIDEQNNSQIQVQVQVDDSEISSLETALSGITAIGISSTANEMMDVAGRISDSWNRLDLTFGGVTADLKSKISSVASATGRSGATVRDYFNKMGIAGVTNVQAIGDSFESMAGFAYQSGKDVSTLTNIMQRMVMSGTANTRMLASLGISTQKLGEAMGVTADQVSDTFKSLSNEERMEALVKAMGDGTKANEMYKNSWEGVKEKASAEFAGLMGAVGTPILSFMIPLMHQLTKIVQTLTTTFKAIPQPIQTAIGGLLAGAIGLTTFAGMLPSFVKAITGLQKGFEILSGISSSIPKIGSKFASFGKEVGKVVDTASGVGAVGAKGAVAGAEMEATSVTLGSIATGAMSMLAPLLELSVVIAVMIPVVTLLVAEAMICIKALQLLLVSLSFDSVDLSGTVKALKQIGESIWEICKAMATMIVASYLTMLYQGISAIMLFNDPIKIAVDELKKTASLIKGFSEIIIPENVLTNLQTLTTSLGAVAKAMWSLESVGVSVLAGSVLTLNGILGTLSQNLGVAKRELSESAKQINSMSELNTIDEGVASKLEAVTSSLANVGKAMGALSDVNWDINMGNIVNLGGAFGTITSHLEDAKDEIIKAAPVINQFSSLPDIDQSAGEKLKKVSDAIKNVADSLKNLNGLSKSMGGDNGALGAALKKLQLGTVIRIAKSTLTDTAKQLQGLKDLPDIPDGIKTKLSKIGSTTATVINTLKPLTKIQNMNVNSASIASKVAQARYAISNSAIHLASLSGISTIPDDISAKLSKIGSTATSLINTLKPLVNITNMNINSAGIVSKIAQARYAVSNSVIHLVSLSGICTIPDDISTKLSKVGSTATTLINTLKPLLNIANMNVNAGAITTKIAQARYAISNSATHIASLAGISTIPEIVSENLNRVSTTARQVATAATNLNTIPVVANASLNVMLAVTAIKTAITQLNSLSGTSLNGGIGALLTSVTNALNQLKTTLYAMSGGFSSAGASIGASIVTGVRTGMSGLSPSVRSSVSGAINSSAGTASSGGRRLGTNVTTGFKSTLHLSGAMKTEMSNVISAINNGISEAKRVAEQGGEGIVQAFKNGLQVGSPGEMYWTMVGEYNYIKDMMKGTVGLFSHLSENLGTAMVDSFGVSGQGGLSDSVNGGLIPIGNNSTNSPTINIYVDGNINDEDTMDSLVDKLTRALTWSNATGNRSV